MVDTKYTDQGKNLKMLLEEKVDFFMGELNLVPLIKTYCKMP